MHCVPTDAISHESRDHHSHNIVSYSMFVTKLQEENMNHIYILQSEIRNHI